MKRIVVLSFAALLTGCASTHDMSDGSSSTWGGGHLVKKKGAQRYHIITKTNWAPWANYSDTRKMWAEQAEKHCGSKNYSEIKVKERVYEALPSPWLMAKYLITEKDGYALCK